VVANLKVEHYMLGAVNLKLEHHMMVDIGQVEVHQTFKAYHIVLVIKLHITVVEHHTKLGDIIKIQHKQAVKDNLVWADKLIVMEDQMLALHFKC
jgi:hypothetical protein